jgi:hypothetical protein
MPEDKKIAKLLIEEYVQYSWDIILQKKFWLQTFKGPRSHVTHLARNTIKSFSVVQKFLKLDLMYTYIHCTKVFLIQRLAFYVFILLLEIRKSYFQWALPLND